MAKVTMGGRDYDVEVRGATVVVDGHEFPIKVRNESGYDTVTAGAAAYHVTLPAEAERASGMTVEVDGRPLTVAWDGGFGGAATAAGAPKREARTATAAPPARASVPGGVSSQIAGRVLTVKVKAGDVVQAGDVLLILEAMKMENEIKAPKAGTVTEILATEGTRVTEGQTLVVVA